ncbi:DUF3068 domain-containing protein [Blastococcus sp. TF02A-30]|uniref:DUF3068 domain-containing protein n=1 Tax=Blastococcus sp. TF02A-30 TaxID=2250580 RepID=UPI000DE8B0B9|nr:DUF3068 domain-containing protein [Blastococcus sp. TF02A-30]RBY87891.1 hypothetical protein DQ241_11645 [Blastococcus sp. TF02A-30]
MRRRAIGLGLVGLGAFALVAALLVRLVLVDTLVRLPLDQTASPRALGTDVSFLDLSEMRQLRGLEATVEQRVAGEPAAEEASDDVAVWNFGSTMVDEDGELLNAYTYRVCLDRREAVAVECESDHIDNDEDRSVEGLTLTFPFGTEKRDYDVFNPTTGETFPARFEEVEEIEGLEVYKFVQVVPETVIRETAVPGNLVGSDEATVEAEVVYSNERTMWIEPRSGVQVTASEKPRTVLRGPDGATGATVLAGSFAGDEQTIADGVERAEDTAGKINLITNVLPLLLLVLGVLALAGGVVLSLRADRAARDEGDARHAEQTEEIGVR